MPSVILAPFALSRAFGGLFIAKMTRDYRWWGEIGSIGAGYLYGRLCESR